MQIPLATTVRKLTPISPGREYDHHIARINRELDILAESNTAGESSLANCSESLYHASKPWGRNHWLTLTRLIELTLYSAGRFADAGRFREVGDLMFNPRRKLLYIKGRGAPLKLARHTPITHQVRHLVPPGMDTKQWLKRETVLKSDDPALLAGLVRLLKSWPELDERYLMDVESRMKQVVSTLCFMQCMEPAGGRAHVSGLNRPVSARRPVTGKRGAIWPHNNLCRFNLVRFHLLGRELIGKEISPSDCC